MTGSVSTRLFAVTLAALAVSRATPDFGGDAAAERGAEPVYIVPAGAASGGTIFLDLDSLEAVTLVAGDDAPGGAWYEIRPVPAEYDNHPAPRDPFDFRLAKIRYVVRRLDVRGRVLDLRALDAREGGEAGTRYYAYSGSEPVIEPTEKALHKAESGRIIQVARRRGDGFLSYLGELEGTPFAWAPAAIDGYLQIDERVCSDCASFVAYGMRRLGLRADPRGPEELRRDLGLPLVDSLRWEPLRRTVTDVRGVPAASPPALSILHFGGHLAVFLEDRPPVGILDGGDILYQSLGVAPGRVELGEVPYLDGAIAVYAAPRQRARPVERPLTERPACNAAWMGKPGQCFRRECGAGGSAGKYARARSKRAGVFSCDRTPARGL